MGHIDPGTRIQFLLIREIAGIFGSARIRFWLRGGWALDFLTGKVTRSHADVDLVAWKRHTARVRRLLGEQGYRLVKNTAAQSNFEKRGQDVDVVFFQRSLRGRMVTPGFEHWPWPPGAFGEIRGRIREVECRVISPFALLAEKETYLHYTGRPLRAKDRMSIENLRRVLSREVDFGQSRSIRSKG